MDAGSSQSIFVGESVTQPLVTVRLTGLAKAGAGQEVPDTTFCICRRVARLIGTGLVRLTLGRLRRGLCVEAAKRKGGSMVIDPPCVTVTVRLKPDPTSYISTSYASALTAAMIALM